MMEHHHLIVGTVFENGPPPHTVDLVGEAMGAVQRGPPMGSQLATGGLVRQKRTLYRCEGETPFAVHTLEDYGGEPYRTVGRLERYASWSELLEVHPDLAQRVATALHRGAVPPLAHPEPGAVVSAVS